MIDFSENAQLKILQSVFKEYCEKDQDYMSKLGIFKFFYEYKLIDTCGYNIFQINDFLQQLNPNEDIIELKMFLKLLFHIYKTQYMTEEEKSNSDSKVSDVGIREIKKISSDSLSINKTDNIIRMILSRYKNKDKDSNDNYKFVIPDFSNEDIQYICKYEILSFLSNYMNSIEEKIFNEYATPLEDQIKSNLSHKAYNNNLNNNMNNFKAVNIAQINTLIFDFPIFKNFNCTTIANYLCLFITDIPSEHFNEFKSAFDEKLSGEDIEKIFYKFYNTPNSDINFSFSSLCILLAQFAIKLQSSQDKDYQEAIKFLFEEQFCLISSNPDLNEPLENELKEEQDIDYLPDSETLNNAKNNIYDYDKSFIEDLLTVLDKNLPEADKTILSLANDIPSYNNLISYNPYKYESVKFPLEKLKVEKDEEDARLLKEREDSKIERAKKNKKRNARDPPPKVIFMEDLPDKKQYELKYRGHKLIDNLSNRLTQNTMKEKLGNTNVYPSLLLESLIVPNDLPSKVKEIIVKSYEDQAKGYFEIAIKRLEKAERAFEENKGNAKDNKQIKIFFKLSFGYLYEAIDLNIVALKNYYDASTVQLYPIDPDRALVYCFFGAIFLKLSELEWSLRCYQHAKEIREEIIGGDTLDTAAVYNNLGVVCFYMESYLPAKNYFALAYEITRSILGIAHPRTILIKSNITKLNHLSFNKSITFKTLSKYPVPPMQITNPKKKKKK